MTEQDWDDALVKSVAVFLNGLGIPDRGARGQRVVDDSFLLCFNAHDEPIDFVLPPVEYAAGWEVVLDTATDGSTDHRPHSAGDTLAVTDHSMRVLRRSA